MASTKSKEGVGSEVAWGQSSKQALFTHHYAATPDGSKLSYYSIGTGPGILVLHGAVSCAITHTELAVALSPWYTVHIASRRGRGLSGPYPESLAKAAPHSSASVASNPPKEAKAKDGSTAKPDKEDTLTIGNKSFPRTYDRAFSSGVLTTETSDLETLLAVTGAVYLVVLSSGAVITLNGLLNPQLTPTLHAQVRKAVIFEPPILFEDRAMPHIIDMTLLPRFERESAAGDDVSAMVTAMYMVQLGPTWIPRPVMRFLSGLMFRAEEKKVAKEKEKRQRVRAAAAGAKTDGPQTADKGDAGNGDLDDEDRGNCTFRGLGAMLRYDFAIVEGGTVLPVARFAALSTTAKPGNADGAGGVGRKVELLLLGGDKAPQYVQDAMDILEEAIPGVKRVVIPGVGHEVLCNKEMRGQPAKAVPTIREFLK